MELSETVALMNSSDYKERFKAEYFQTKIRCEKLHTMMVKREAGTLGFEPVCSNVIFQRQKAYMQEYLKMLEVRAEIEGIDLSA